MKKEQIALNIEERLLLSSILPLKEDPLVMMRVKNLKEKIGLTEEEDEEFRPMITKDGRFFYDFPSKEEIEAKKKELTFNDQLDNESFNKWFIKERKESYKRISAKRKLFNIGETVFDLIRKIMEDKADKKEISEGLLPLYEIFVKKIED